MIGQAYQSVNLDEDTGLRMLDRENVAVNGDSPSLINAHFSIARHAVNHRSQLGAKEENIDPAVLGNVVQSVGNLLFQSSGSKITDKMTLHIDRCTTLDWHSLIHTF